jgi:hypothetical protein
VEEWPHSHPYGRHGWFCGHLDAIGVVTHHFNLVGNRPRGYPDVLRPSGGCMTTLSYSFLFFSFVTFKHYFKPFLKKLKFKKKKKKHLKRIQQTYPNMSIL